MKNVITIATGKKLYVNLAVNLARSFWYWNRDTDINFYIVTDNEDGLPVDIRKFVKIIKIKKDELGKGFTPKLYLDRLAPAGQTLFIDSDCLVYGNLDPVFKKFKGHGVSVIGNLISDGEWFGEVRHICRQFKIPHLPKFNGGVYYLENEVIATQVYQKARELEKKYDEIGFVRLRGRPNDEVLMALALQLFNQQIVDEDGTIMAEFVNFQSGIESDLLKGHAVLYNLPKSKNYNQHWPLVMAKPIIIHYLGHHNQIHPYTKETKILELLARGYSKASARLLSLTYITLPYKIKVNLKKWLRPAYRVFFGFRKSTKSERIID